jgi:ABC-type Mn2+/Zn2+ transport system ATPase subunit
VLRDVCLALDAGEVVCVWGQRRSGRSTLMRVAAGVQPPDSGVVRFAGVELAGWDADVHRGAIAYCRSAARPVEGREVFEQLITDQLSRGVSPTEARKRAEEALEWVHAAGCAALRLGELDAGEATRVAIARALTRSPRLVVIDEPALGVDLLERDAILGLLRSLADAGIAVFSSAGDTTAFAGADRALSLDRELHGSLEPELAPVVPLRIPA